MSKHKAYIVASNGKVECVVLVTSFIHEGQAEADITVSKTFAGQGQEQVRKELIELNWAVFCPWII